MFSVNYCLRKIGYDKARWCFAAKWLVNRKNRLVLSFGNRDDIEQTVIFWRSEPSLSSWGWSIASKQQAKLFAEHCTFQLKKTITPSLVVKHWRVQKTSLPTEVSFLPFTIPLHISIPFIFPDIPCLILCQALSTLHVFLLINPALNECIWVTLTLSQPSKNNYSITAWN